MKVDVAFQGGGIEKTVNNVTATLSNYSKTLESAEGKAHEDVIGNHVDAIKLVTTVSISNTVPSTNADFTIGTIEVTISNP